MYTVGAPVAVHRNGRVNYEESGRTRADGDDGSVAARVAAGAVNAAYAELCRVGDGERGGGRRGAGRGCGERCGTRRGGDAAFTAAGGWGAEDDEDDLDGDGFFGGHDDFDDVDDSDLDADVDSDEDKEENEDGGDGAGRGAGGGGAEADPPSFSRVDRDDLGASSRGSPARTLARGADGGSRGRGAVPPGGLVSRGDVDGGRGDEPPHGAKLLVSSPGAGRGGRVDVRVRDSYGTGPEGDVGGRLGDVGGTPPVERGKIEEASPRI